MTMLQLLRRVPRATLHPSTSTTRNYSQPPSAVDKDHGLDVQSDNANKGMADHANAQRNAGEQAKQAGGAGKKVSWDDEFPHKPKGPVIGLQDERGGAVPLRHQQTGLTQLIRIAIAFLNPQPKKEQQLGFPQEKERKAPFHRWKAIREEMKDIGVRTM
ncbi:hypothetical protein L211DRAFT_871248 [Terfezia boudieri ATCC MYA-4762]|uniref:Uncharacterized protein n=1 Tax=Terfezia boudieri ATCC MYA-4762 TaxID=1051890 RepID=A0A3N4LFR9_9PEZI|nr:hypothetical protein L211DRAFT_871248 [Terfezia boudieri ATCC MYA-4762]